LISAPTGSGKTLAAFLICIDRLVRKALSGELIDQTEVLYVSPLKALSNDIQKNLEVPLGEILQLAGQQGVLMPEIRTAVRTSDTLAHWPFRNAKAYRTRGRFSDWRRPRRPGNCANRPSARTRSGHRSSRQRVGARGIERNVG